MIYVLSWEQSLITKTIRDLYWKHILQKGKYGQPLVQLQITDYMRAMDN